jgi:predicted lysophospholipase L1 biosynthesis ABC-type transport system permease subunit
VAVSSSDNPVLAALGMTRGQLMASRLIEVGVAAAAGAVAAIGVVVSTLGLRHETNSVRIWDEVGGAPPVSNPP